MRKCRNISALYLQVVQRKKGLRLSSLLLNVLDTISARLLRVHDDGVHVFAQNLRNGDLIFLLSGLAQVDETAVLETKQSISVGLLGVGVLMTRVTFPTVPTTRPGYSLLMLSMISALRCCRLFSCLSILASPSCSITCSNTIAALSSHTARNYLLPCAGGTNEVRGNECPRRVGLLAVTDCVSRRLPRRCSSELLLRGDLVAVAQ